MPRHVAAGCPARSWPIPGLGNARRVGSGQFPTPPHSEACHCQSTRILATSFLNTTTLHLWHSTLPDIHLEALVNLSASSNFIDQNFKRHQILIFCKDFPELIEAIDSPFSRSQHTSNRTLGGHNPWWLPRHHRVIHAPHLQVVLRVPWLSPMTPESTDNHGLCSSVPCGANEHGLPAKTDQAL